MGTTWEDHRDGCVYAPYTGKWDCHPECPVRCPACKGRGYNFDPSDYSRDDCGICKGTGVTTIHLPDSDREGCRCATMAPTYPVYRSTPHLPGCARYTPPAAGATDEAVHVLDREMEERGSRIASVVAAWERLDATDALTPEQIAALATVAVDTAPRSPAPERVQEDCHKTRGWHGRRDAEGRCVDCGKPLPPGPPDSPRPPRPNVS